MFCLLQLWQASGQLQQRLTCDRKLYFPESAVLIPVLKQLPDDSVVEAQQGKRAKLAGGQYRRSSFRESASDGTPPSTPYRPSRSGAVDERTQSNPIASSSSSQDMTHLQERRQSACSVDEVAWPLSVPNKRRRSSRTRRSNWQQWCSVLQGVDVATPAGGVADAALQQSVGPESGAEALLQQQRLQLQQLLLQQHDICRFGKQHEIMQLDTQQQDVQQQDQAQPASCARVAALNMQPPAPRTAAVDHVVVAGAGVVKAAAGDASPGHETSQGSEMTCMQDSPHAVPLQLTSWPSTSSDSDCQGQAPDGDVVHKSGLVVAIAAGVGVSAAATAAAVVAAAHRSSGHHSTPESPSSAFNGVEHP